MTERKAVAYVSEDNGFKFISVEEDEDEIVIQAGMPQAVSDRQDVEDDASDVMPYSDDEIAFDEVESDEESFYDIEEEDDEDAIERARFEREKARRQALAEANRMITTEEDLHASVPFANMRRIIIVAAIVLIVVFLLYYNFGGM